MTEQIEAELRRHLELWADVEITVPDLASLEREGRARAARRRGWTAAVAAAVAVVVAIASVSWLVRDGREVAPAPPLDTPTIAASANGWVAVDAPRAGGGDIYLLRPGEVARRLEVAGADAADDACPAWSPDGTRLMFGRLTGSPDETTRRAELVIVPVDGDGSAGTPSVIDLEGFEVLPDFDPYPCAIWAPDGRFAALAGTGEVWIIDTETGAVRRLPDMRPVDLEWRPGTDELAMAGDLGPTRGAEAQSRSITVYSVSTGEFRRLGSSMAESITWSPDGATLAFRTGEDGGPGSLGLVDADGTNERSLVADAGAAILGIGPVWSPAGDRIVYQRQVDCCEAHEVVLVNVADGTEEVVDAPRGWRPFHVSWSPDGTKLLYAAWNHAFNGGRAARIVVPVDTPDAVEVLTDRGGVTDYVSHRWVYVQAWGRQPERGQP